MVSGTRCQRRATAVLAVAAAARLQIRRLEPPLGAFGDVP